MVSICAIGSDHLVYYLDMIQEDQINLDRKEQGYWEGTGALLSGLSGPAKRETLYNLFDGLTPDGMEAALQFQTSAEDRWRVDHRSGWDITMSVPKSVSVLWANSPPSLRLEIEEAARAAVSETIKYLEDEACFTRRGRGGRFLEHAKIFTAIFEHKTSRLGDPNLHFHVLLANHGIRPDGSPGSLHSPSVYRAKMAAGAVFQLALSDHIQRLGVAIERDRFSFRIRAVPQELEWEMSKRRRDIEILMDQRGSTSAKMASVATIQTRRPKGSESLETLFRRWEQESHKFDFGQREATAAFTRTIGEERSPTDLQGALEAGLKEVQRDLRHFTASDFIRRVTPHAFGLGFTSDEVRTASERFLANSAEVKQTGWGRGARIYAPLNGSEEKPSREPKVQETRVSIRERQDGLELTSVRSVAFSVKGVPYSGVHSQFVKEDPPRAAPKEIDAMPSTAKQVTPTEGEESRKTFDRKGSVLKTAGRALYKISEAGAITSNELLETFVRFTRSNQTSFTDSIMVVGTEEEAFRVNAIVQRQRRKDRELDEMFIRAEHATFFVMDQVRMICKDLTTRAHIVRTATVEKIDPKGMFMELRFSDGGRVNIPAHLLPLVSLGYAIPSEKLTEAFAPKRLFIFLNEKVYKDLKMIEPHHPENAVEFCIASVGRVLSTRLKYELTKSDRQVKEERRLAAQRSPEHGHSFGF